MLDPFEYAKEEHDRIHDAVKAFAVAIGCEMSEEGGKKFARIVVVAVTEALRGHLKNGQWWSGQNRPTEVAGD